MKPVAFQRMSDGELFTLNADKATYSIEANKREFPGNRIGEWTEETLSGLPNFRHIFDEDLLASLLKERFK